MTPREPTALPHLSSAVAGQLKYGAAHDEQHSPDTYTLTHWLFVGVHGGRGRALHDEAFRRDYVKEHLKRIPREYIEAYLKQSKNPIPRDRGEPAPLSRNRRVARR